MRILILDNYSMGLYRFRKELIEELVRQKNEVYVCSPYDKYVEKIKGLGCEYIEAKIERRSVNPIKDLKLMLFYLKIIRIIKPDVVLTYTIKPNVYGGIACRITKTPYLSNVTGLGTSIENRGLIQKIALFLYKIGLKKSRCVFFQNKSNMNKFMDKKIVKGNKRVLPGSEVNLVEHQFEDYPESEENIRFLFIGRIMKEKGIDELLEAARRIKERYSNVHFELIGFCEEGYAVKLQELMNLGIIEYYGLQDDVHTFIKNSHAVILPSYHEGMSNALLESATTGRPVIASKITGCMETFDDGISGLGFEVKNVDSLEQALIKFIQLPLEKKRAMGVAGRGKMEREFNRQIVVSAYIEEIENIKKRIS